MAFEEKQIAKELTLAAIPHLRLYGKPNTDDPTKHNEVVAEEIGKVFEIIFKAVTNASRS